MLQLAIRRLQNSDKSFDTTMIPIIINISSWETYNWPWENQYERFKKWLYQYIQDGYWVSEKYSQSLFNDNIILPIFDGFDELWLHEWERNKILLRSKFLRLHLRFLETSDIPYHILTSRFREFEWSDFWKTYQKSSQRIEIETYSLIEIKDELNEWLSYQQSSHRVEIEALKLEQIKYELNKVKTQKNKVVLSALLLQFKEDEYFEKTISNPFYFNLLTRLIKGDDSFHISKKTTKKEYQTFLIQSYKEKCIQKLQKHFSKYSTENIERYLWFISFVMQDNAKESFELIDLNYKYAINKNKLRVYAEIILSSIWWLSWGISIYLFLWIIYWIIGVFFFWLFWFLWWRLTSWVDSKFNRTIVWAKLWEILHEYPIQGKRKFDLIKWIQEWKKTLILAIICAIFFWIEWIIFWIILWIGMITGLTLGTICWFFLGIIIWLFWNSFSTVEFSEIKHPYQKINTWFGLEIIKTLLLIWIIWTTISLSLNNWLYWVCSFIIISIFSLNGINYTKLFINCTYLAIFQKDIPDFMKLVDFLNKWSNWDEHYNLFIKPNGWSWRFQHRLIQEAFFPPEKLKEERERRWIKT